MDTPPQKPLGQLALFLTFVLLAAVALLFAMRAVTPAKDHMDASKVTTTVPTPVVPKPFPTQKPSKPDGKPAAVSSTAPDVLTPVRARPAGALCDGQNFICIDSLEENALVDNPMVVTGTAIGFESTFSWRLEDAQGTMLAQSYAMTNAPDTGQPGAFEIRIFWETLPTTVTGFFTAFESSARDGSPTHVVKIPVQFVKRATITQNIYFVPEKTTGTDCSVVKASPVSMPSSIRPIESTLRALLAVDSSDGPVGLATMIPDRTQLVSLVVNNGTATAVFDAGLERDGGGSCRVLAIRSQIEKTLLQFPSVKKVVISVQGKTPEETLQP